MLSEGRIQTTDVVAAEGQLGPPRLGKSFEIFVSEAHARYYDAVRRGNVFVAAIPVTALSVNSTTATGIILANPTGSGKALVLLEVCVGISTSTTTSAGVILTGGAQVANVAAGNTITIQNAYMGKGGTPAAYASSGLTIATATMIRSIWDTALATSATAATPAPMPYIKDQIDGAIIVGPGQVISLQAITTAISVHASMTWEEVPYL